VDFSQMLAARTLPGKRFRHAAAAAAPAGLFADSDFQIDGSGGKRPIDLVLRK